MTTIIENFVKKALSEEQQFSITKDSLMQSTIYFIKIPVGKAECIYGRNVYQKHYLGAIDKPLSPYAIVSNKKVYIIKSTEFGRYEPNDLPPNVLSLSDTTKAFHQNMRDLLFPIFYGSLEIKELTEEDEQHAKNEVRNVILRDNGKVNKPTLGECNLLKHSDMANILYGFLDFNDFVTASFEKNKNYFIKIKSINNRIEQLIQEQCNVEDWEIEMYNALKKSQAKTITVDFLFQGKTGTEKIYLEWLLQKIRKKDYFSDSDNSFVSGNHGKELIEALGAGIHRNSGKELLTCDHITKITYNRKVIYSQ